MSLVLEVELKDGKLYHEGKPVDEKGKFYLVREGTFEEILSRIRERNTSQNERELEMPDEIREQFPPSIEITDDNGFTYHLVPSIGMLKGKFLYIRYKTLEEELDEALEKGQTE